MIAATYSQKHYRSAQGRFLQPLLTTFFQRELPRLGPILSQRLAEEVLRIFEAVCPVGSRLQPGQLLWNVIDKNTRADAPNRRFVPAILTLVHPDDVRQLVEGTPPAAVFRHALARLFREAHAQGGLLSTRDAALFFHRHDATISTQRQRYETEHQCVLPHPGTLQDMGSTISHKALVVRKVVRERKDPAQVAQEIHHSQPAVDRYLRDYHRVKTLYELKPDLDFIHLARSEERRVGKECRL